MRSVWTVALVILGCLGCAPRVDIEALVSSEVSLPTAVRAVGIVDGSGPRNFGDRALGSIEGLLTGETIGTDREAASRAVRRLAAVLQDSPRFDRVVALAPSAALLGGPGGGYDWAAIRETARRADVDAIVVLESLDHDNPVSTRALEATDDSGPRFEARRSTTLSASWRVYDPYRQTILDAANTILAEDEQVASGATEDDALAALPPAHDSVVTVGENLGGDYARRIAPYYAWIQRNVLVGGDPALKDARRYVVRGDWDGAASIWRERAEDETLSPKVRGKCLHNLAIHHERLGDLYAARDAAVASSQTGLVRGTALARALRSRIHDAQRVDDQLGE